MWRPSSTRPRGISAYEYNTRYNLQPTEDQEEARDVAERKGYSTAFKKRPDYKPTALRWYFIVLQIILLCVMIAIVAYCRAKMPDSDNTATIEERSLNLDWEAKEGLGMGVFKRREELAQTTGVDGLLIPPHGVRAFAGPTPVLAARETSPTVAPTAAPSATPSYSPSFFIADIITIMKPSYIQSLIEDSSTLVSQAEQEKNGIEIDTEIPLVPCGTSTVCTTTITRKVITTLIIPATTEVFTITMGATTVYHITEVEETVTQPDVVFTTDVVTEIEDVSEVVETTVFTLGKPPLPGDGSFPGNSTRPPAPPQLTTQTRTSSQTITQTVTTPSVGTSAGTTGVITKTLTETEVIPKEALATRTGEEQTYFQLGETTIEVTYTPPPQERVAGVAEPPVTQIITTVDPGKTVVDVVQDQPFQVVVNDNNEVKTVVVGAQVDQVVQQVGGDVTNMVVVVTPVPVGVGRAGSNGKSGSNNPGQAGQFGNPGDGSGNVQNFGDPDRGGSNSGQGNSNSGQGNSNSGQGNSNSEQGHSNSGQGNSNSGQGNSNSGQGGSRPGLSGSVAGQGGSDNSGQDGSRLGQGGSDNLGQGGSRPGQSGSGNSGQGGSSAGQGGSDNLGQGNLGQGNSGQGNSGQGGSRPGQGGARPGQDGSGSDQQDFGDDSGFDGGFAPISLTVVSHVGGQLTVFTTQDSPQTIVTTNPDGSPTTIITTPPPRVATSTIGGSLTTFEIVTTPTASDLLSFTVVSTIGGTLSTILTTKEPTTYVTTLSGTPTTITSTPSARTVTSTVKATTRTIVSVTTPTPTDEPPQTETKVYNVDAAKYFLGKFLPALLAIILAIPLRIIDLNAKLYQPFYTLNQERGALGPDSMTLHFNGFKALTKPFEMLFQGHPMTLLTSIILWGSSLMVPLATEAIGLKIHGKCTINSIAGCGLELGVSPGPTHALLALLALIVTFLLVLLFITRNYESGLFANPWNLAGIASLARCRDVRIHSSKKETIRKETTERRYGFGFFRNDENRDEYGIVLLDDSGQNLRQDRDNDATIDNHSDSEEDDHVYDAPAGPARRRSSSLSTENQRTSVPFLALTYPWRIIFILFLLGLFIVILYYHVKVMDQSDLGLQSFMNSRKFGARFLFAGFGVIITFAWFAFFVSKCAIYPSPSTRRSRKGFF